MGRKSIAALFVLIALPVVVYFLWPSDEQRIRKLIREGASAVEREALDEVMSKVSLNYRDEYGLSYLLLKDVVKRQLGYYSDIDVGYENLTVRVDKGKAEASMDLMVLARAGGERGYIFGDLKEPVRLRLELEKDALKRWLVTGSSGLDRPRAGANWNPGDRPRAGAKQDPGDKGGSL